MCDDGVWPTQAVTESLGMPQCAEKTAHHTFYIWQVGYKYHRLGRPNAVHLTLTLFLLLIDAPTPHTHRLILIDRVNAPSNVPST